MPTTHRLTRVALTTTLFVSLATGMGAHLAPQAAEQTPGVDGARWLVLVDDLHLDFPRTGRVRAAITAVVRPLFDAGVLGAIRSNGPSSLALTADDTTAWPAVAATIKRVTGNALKSSDIVQMLASPGGTRELTYRAGQTRAAVDVLLREAGRRPAVLLLVSNGYRTDVPGVSEHLAEAAAMAGRALVPVVAVDPRLFAADAEILSGGPAIDAQRHLHATTTSLQLLARDTGGTIWEDGDTLTSVVTRLPRRLR